MKILWIKTELLHPVDKGGKIRTYEMLKQLKREHHVTYLTLDDGTAGPEARQRAAEYCHQLVCVPHRMRAKFTAGFYGELALSLASPLPYAIGKYASAEMRREIAKCVERDKPDVLICDFLTPSINVPGRLPCATVLFQHNVEAMIWRRYYETQANPLKRSYFHSQWRKMRALEREQCLRFDQVIAVSREDQDMMQRDYGVKMIANVPTGVDTDYFRPQPDESVEPGRLVFTGSMDWMPNVDAIHYFVEQILPLVRSRVPNVTLTVVGRAPHPSLLELSKLDPAITVTGRVEDVRPYIRDAAGYVVPIRIGGGTRLKIYEAMAMAKPVISTTVGAEGLPVRHGEELLIADTPTAFADEVIRVLTDGTFARNLGTRAAATVQEQFSWKRVASVFSELCRDARARRAVSPTAEEHTSRKVA
jgi:sugar transferase (PEP-CTERM/EpsH1 system associated)